MANSSRRLFIKTAAISGIMAPFASPVFAMGSSRNQHAVGDKDNYLESIKQELLKHWPNNRTINYVFHGHSVPSGYFKTPDVQTLQAYPHLLLKQLMQVYPLAVINTILTCIGGENSQQCTARFKKEVLNHRPDVPFID